MFNKKVEDEQLKIIKAALAPLNEHHATVEAMVLKNGENFYGYKPLDVTYQDSKGKIAQNRQDELALEFVRIASELYKYNFEILFCTMNLDEGGSLMYVPQDTNPLQSQC
ncbi:MAG: hypothetical protein NC218_04525 [Acetobacter sp.]|nr:hypothetical protein [Acetobacter sp.]